MKIFSQFQSKNRKKGFTLVELMIVVMLISAFFLMARSMNFTVSINQQKSEQLADKIHDVIRNTRHNTVVGKVGSGGVSVPRRIIEITPYGSGSDANNMMKVFYEYNDDSMPPKILSGSEAEISLFIDGDTRYRVTEIGVSDEKYGEIPQEFVPAKKISLFIPDDLSGKIEAVMSGTTTLTSDKIRSYLITVDYDGIKRYVYGDVLTGNIETLKPADIPEN